MLVSNRDYCTRADPGETSMQFMNTASCATWFPQAWRSLGLFQCPGITAVPQSCRCTNTLKCTSSPPVALHILQCPSPVLVIQYERVLSSPPISKKSLSKQTFYKIRGTSRSDRYLQPYAQMAPMPMAVAEQRVQLSRSKLFW